MRRQFLGWVPRNARSLSNAPASAASPTSPSESAFFAEKLSIDLKLHHVPLKDTPGGSLGLIQMHKQGLDTACAPVAFLLHGAISNGYMFWSSSGKGLGPYLASKGVNVFIGDTRGRGFSVPSITQEAKDKGTVSHGQVECIRDDLPALVAAVSDLSGRSDGKQHWVTHSWGGVLLSSSLARFGAEIGDRVQSMVCLGTKKYIGERKSWEFFKAIAFGWNLVCPLIAKHHGYLPATKYKFGMDEETITSLRDCSKWIDAEHTWVDPTDGTDYLAAWNKLSKRPATWHIAATNDPFLGNPKDVQRWAQLTGQTQKFTELSKALGNLEDYSHNTMLTSKVAVDDHFPKIFEWIQEHEKMDGTILGKEIGAELAR